MTAWPRLRATLRRLGHRLACLMGEHEWTSAADQGRQPTREQIARGLDGFRDYARMYCKHCDRTGGTL